MIAKLVISAKSFHISIEISVWWNHHGTRIWEGEMIFRTLPNIMCVCLIYAKCSMSRADFIFPNSLSSITPLPVFPISVNSTTIQSHLKQKSSVIFYSHIQTISSSNPQRKKSSENTSGFRLSPGMPKLLSQIPQIFSTLTVTTLL